MPDWETLLRRLVAVARRSAVTQPQLRIVRSAETALREADYSLAASLLRQTLQSSELDLAMRSEFDLSVYRNCGKRSKTMMTARLKNLVAAPWAGIITTNYDDLIEHALGRWVEGEINQTSGFDPRLGTVLANPNSSRFFVKLHGSVTTSRIVLSTEEYDRTYTSSPQVTAFLTGVMLRYHLVFIGCSLEDEILRLRRKLVIEFSGVIPVAYALLPSTPGNAAREPWLREHAQIECMLYPKDDKEHRSLDRFLVQASRLDKALGITNDVLSTTVERMSKQPLVRRLRLLGTINRTLLEWIAVRGDQGVGSFDVIDCGSTGGSAPGELLNVSSEERFYRVLFLVSIGLLQDRHRDGRPTYFYVPQRVRQELS
jgi:hypothetical protein